MSILEKRLEGYQRLVAIARDLASTLDLDVLLNRIIHAAADLTEADGAMLLFYDDASRQLTYQAATHLDPQSARGLVIPMECSLAGWVVTNRRSVRIANAQQDARHYKKFDETLGYTTRSLLGVPLIAKDKLVGVIQVIDQQEGVFTAAHEDLLSVLGAQAAVAIENARLFQQSDLIAEFVHELRTPLASISASTYLLLRPEMASEQRSQMVQTIHNETLRLNTLASSFLDLARLESGRAQFHLTRFELPVLLDECRQLMQAMADEQALKVKIEVPADFPSIEADREKMQQVVLNLLSNAIKYNCRNGSVTMALSCQPKQWTLSVTDTGMGIPDTSLPHLFEKFYRVRSAEEKIPGTGLGLSICKQIVAAHGGGIEVASTPGQGTKFTIHMPMGA